MIRFNHTKWMILLIGIFCGHGSYAESTNKAITLTDMKEMKLEVTDNDGRVFVKEINGDEMACVMKCFPVKRCQTKAEPEAEEEIVVHTTPIPTDTEDAIDTTEAKMTTISFRSTSLAKQEQAVSAEATTEMSHSAKEENQEVTDNRELNAITKPSSPTITIDQNSASGSVANDRPISSLTFETIYDVKAITTSAPKQHDPYSDYNTLSSGSNLDSLDLVMSSEPLTKTPTPTNAPTSQRRYETKSTKNVHSTLILPSPTTPPAVTPPELVTTEFYPTETENQNLRRHSQEEHEDYDIECDPTESNSVHNLHSEATDTLEDQSTIPPSLTPTEKPFLTPPVETGESMRRMSESDEVSTECDSAEDLGEMPKSSTTIEKVNEPLGSINMVPDEITTTDQTTITDSMRRMSESNEIQTECDSVENNEQSVTEQSVTKINLISPTVYPTQAEESTTMSPFNGPLSTLKPKELSVNELARRMSESDVVGCLHNGKDSIQMTPITDSMRRMSDSNENSSDDCDSHADFIEVTTTASTISDSMRRISGPDQPTTEQYYEEQTEFVTECDTVAPDIPHDVHKTVETKKNATLECCPDLVCSLLFPAIPICEKQRAATYIRKLVELRDMFYLNRAHVLITELVGDEYTRKRTSYERELFSLWNDTLSMSPNNIINDCANSSSSNSVIASIYCVLKYTDSLLLTDSVLEMVVDAAKRIETDFTGGNAKNYLKFRRIILQAIATVRNQSDTVSALANYMHHNRNYENERLLLLQLLIDIQQRFEKKTEKFIASLMNIKITDASKSLQENGVGIKLHRNLN